MSGAATARPRRRRTALAFASALLLALAALEAFSCAALRVTEGRWIGLAALAEARRAVAAGERGAGLGAAAAAGGEAIRDAHVLHPYLGFVMDPRLVERDAQRLGLDPLSVALGFPRNREPVLQAADPERVVVGVFGGSVADVLTVAGADALRRALREAPAFRDREIAVLSLAAPGYKQPQQLMTLAYLVALGAHFDVVVNLDGVNDVAIPPAELAPLGVAPFYPRGWYGRAAALAPALREAIGRAALAAGWRRDAARLFSAPPLAWSFGAGLVWSRIDRVLAARVHDAERRLLGATPARRDPQAQGPELPANPALPEDPYARIAAVWARSSLEMWHLCRGLGITYLHALQPNQYVAGSKPMGDAERAVAWRDDSPFRAGVEGGYPALRAAGAALAAQGLPFADLTDVFADVREPVYIDDCCHLGPRGNALLGAALGRAIARVAPQP